MMVTGPGSTIHNLASLHDQVFWAESADQMAHAHSRAAAVTGQNIQINTVWACIYVSRQGSETLADT